MLHKNSLAGNIHTLVNWEVADATALAALTLSVGDEFKLAHQVDTGELLMLLDSTTNSWFSIASVNSLTGFQPIDPLLTEISTLNYTGNAGKVITVNGTEDGFEFTTPSGGGVTDHEDLTNIGTLTHAQIETELTDLATDISSLSTATSTALGGKQDSDTLLTSLSTLSFTGNTLKVLRVNAGETDFELATPSGGGGGLTNFTEAIATASPNAAINSASLTATGAGSNIGIALVTKGTGTLTADIPNNSTSGGNVRGNYAVDWQLIRAAATDVASGANSTISGGQSNRAGGGSSTVSGGQANRASSTYDTVGGGNDNIASGSTSVIAGGGRNRASGNTSAVLGGDNNNVSGNFSGILYGATNIVTGANSAAGGDSNTVGGDSCIALGQYLTVSASFGQAFGLRASTEGIIGKQVKASGRIAVDGDSQTGHLHLRVQTTNSTPTVLYAGNSSTPAFTNTIGITAKKAMIIKGNIVGTDIAGNTAAFEIMAVAERLTTASTIRIVETPIITLLAADAPASAWAATLNANTTTGAIEVLATGAAATTINWTASIFTTEIAR